jgi:T-complex protein 1 subunit gamma
LEGHYNYGVDGDTGKMTDMKEYGLLESASVKIQTLKTAIEVSTLHYYLLHRSPLISTLSIHPSQDLFKNAADPQSATLLLRVDDIVSARRPEEGGSTGGGVQTMGEPGEDGPEQ